MAETRTGERRAGSDILQRVRVDLIQGRLEVVGADVDDAHVDARYVGAGIGESSDPFMDGALDLVRDGGELHIRAPRGGWRDAIGMRGRGRRVALDVRLVVPRDASLGIDVVGVHVRIAGCRGGQVVRTVTGSVAITDASGAVDVRTVSGDVHITGTRLAPRVATTSGGMTITGDTLTGLRATTVSGDLLVTGRLDADGEHAAESISGDLRLRASSGISLQVRTTSGRARAGATVRRVTDEGATRLVVGDGRASMRFRSVSGGASLEVLDGGPPDVVGRNVQPSDGGTGRPAGSPKAVVELAPDPLLASLEALARGEITVDEADRWLEARHG
ncbi:MAG: DUF4097 family beta strand repeat protein [Chloroflexi bacterium]|nr:DUF4097 family beta strand repeat protein [Chloroflexota bacterium]